MECIYRKSRIKLFLQAFHAGIGECIDCLEMNRHSRFAQNYEILFVPADLPGSPGEGFLEYAEAKAFFADECVRERSAELAHLMIGYLTGLHIGFLEDVVGEPSAGRVLSFMTLAKHFTRDSVFKDFLVFFFGSARADEFTNEWIRRKPKCEYLVDGPDTPVGEEDTNYYYDEFNGHYYQEKAGVFGRMTVDPNGRHRIRRVRLDFDSSNLVPTLDRREDIWECVKKECDYWR